MHTDDPKTPKHKLVFSGSVEKFADIKPKGMIRLAGDVGKAIKKTITITPGEKYPFKITEIKAQKGEDIAFLLKAPKSGQSTYFVTVENTKTKEGRYFDTLILKTTSPIRPEISMRIFGDIRTPKNEVKQDDDS